jgi:hypothetical protein
VEAFLDDVIIKDLKMLNRKLAKDKKFGGVQRHLDDAIAYLEDAVASVMLVQGIFIIIDSH